MHSVTRVPDHTCILQASYKLPALRPCANVHLEVVAAQHHAHNVLANVVHITLQNIGSGKESARGTASMRYGQPQRRRHNPASLASNPQQRQVSQRGCMPQAT